MPGLLLGPAIVPTEPVEIDRTHPLGIAGGLASLWLLNGSARDVSQQQAPLSLFGAPAYASTARGPMLALDGIGQYGTAPDILPNWTGITIAVLFSAIGTQASDVRLFEKGANSEITVNFNQPSPGTGFLYAFLNTGNQNDYTYGVYTSSSYTDGNVHCMVATFEGPIAGNYTTALYIDGVTIGTNTNTHAPFNKTGALNLGQYGGGGYNFDGNVGALIPYGQALPPSLALWLSAEPFAMLRPQARRRAGVNSAVVVSPLTSALALTGLSPTVVLGIALQPASAAFALTGFSPRPSLGYTLQPGAGALELGGVAPSVTFGYTLVPPPGAFSLVGEPPAATIGVTLLPLTAALALAGTTPTDTLGITVTPSAGVLALAGETPALSYGYTLVPPPGALALLGQIPIVTYQNVTYTTIVKLAAEPRVVKLVSEPRVVKLLG